MDNEVVDTPLDTPAAAPAPAPAPAPAEPPSLRETLERNTKILDQPAEPAKRGPGRPRKTPVEAAPGAQEPPAGKTEGEGSPEPKNAPEGDSEETQHAAAEKAPKSWKPTAREKWATVDPEIRAEVHRRERETDKALTESGSARKFASTFQEAVAPFQQRYAQAGLNPIQTVVNLMQADHFLATAAPAQRAQAMAKLISDYQIDIDLLDRAMAGQDTSNHPASLVERMIEQKLQPLQQFMSAQEQQRQAMEQREVQVQRSKIESMAADEEKYPFFNDVRQDMADLIEMQLRRGVLLDPETAYSRAVSMNPEAQAAQRVRAAQEQANKAHATASRSLGASLSVSGAPGGPRTQVSPEDLRGTIEAAIAAHAGR